MLITLLIADMKPPCCSILPNYYLFDIFTCCGVFVVFLHSVSELLMGEVDSSTLLSLLPTEKSRVSSSQTARNYIESNITLHCLYTHTHTHPQYSTEGGKRNSLCNDER